MYEVLLTLHILELIKGSLKEIIKRSESISRPEDFLLSNDKVILLDSICMQLSAVGESVKNLDKVTNKELLVKYPEIPWKNVMGVRDMIVHHYFDIDSNEIFRICKEDIPELLLVIDRMLKEVYKQHTS